MICLKKYRFKFKFICFFFVLHKYDDGTTKIPNFKIVFISFLGFQKQGNRLPEIFTSTKELKKQTKNKICDPTKYKHHRCVMHL